MNKQKIISDADILTYDTYQPTYCHRTLQQKECDKNKCQKECWRKEKEDEIQSWGQGKK